MDLNVLKYYVVTADCGSIAQAAKKLYISRQGLTKALHRLEEEINCPLLSSYHEPITLTSAGQILLQHAQILLKEWETTQQELIQLSQNQPRILRVGYGTMCANLWPVDHIASFMKENPGIEIRSSLMRPDELTEQLANGKLDMIVTSAYPRGAYHYELLARQTLYILMPIGHPLSVKKRITAADLEGQTLFFLPHFQHFLESFKKLAQQAGITVSYHTAPDSLVTMLRYVEHYQGVYLASSILKKMLEPSRDFIFIPFDNQLYHSILNKDIHAISLNGRNDRALYHYIQYLKRSKLPID